MHHEVGEHPGENKECTQNLWWNLNFFWFLHIWIIGKGKLRAGPWHRNFVDARFFCSTCFRPSGAAQQQLGFQNFTAGSVRKWSSGSPIELSVAHGTLVDASSYASAWKQSKRHSSLCQNKKKKKKKKKKGPVASLACLFPAKGGKMFPLPPPRHRHWFGSRNPDGDPESSVLT